MNRGFRSSRSCRVPVPPGQRPLVGNCPQQAGHSQWTAEPPSKLIADALQKQVRPRPQVTIPRRHRMQVIVTSLLPDRDQKLQPYPALHHALVRHAGEMVSVGELVLDRLGLSGCFQARSGLDSRGCNENKNERKCRSPPHSLQRNKARTRCATTPSSAPSPALSLTRFGNSMGDCPTCCSFASFAAPSMCSRTAR